MDHASCHRDCRSGIEPGRLLLVFHGLLQVDAADRPGAAGIDAAGRRCPHLLGPGCKTPCSVAVTPPDTGFTVTYTLNRFQPATVPVQVIRTPGDFTTPASTTIDPNPVVAELQPAGSAAEGRPAKMMRPKKPKPPKAAAAPPRPHRRSRTRRQAPAPTR